MASHPVGGKRLVALVLGYHDVNDGGGGVFVWDAASNVPVDNGTSFSSTTLVWGRWLRLDS